MENQTIDKKTSKIAIPLPTLIFVVISILGTIVKFSRYSLNNFLLLVEIHISLQTAVFYSLIIGIIDYHIRVRKQENLYKVKYKKHLLGIFIIGIILFLAGFWFAWRVHDLFKQ